MYVGMFPMERETAGPILMKFSDNLQMGLAGDPVRFGSDRINRSLSVQRSGPGSASNYQN